MSRRWSMADPAQLLLAFARGNLVAKMPQASRVVEMCREGRCYTTPTLPYLHRNGCFMFTHLG